MKKKCPRLFNKKRPLYAGLGFKELQSNLSERTLFAV